MEKGLGMIALQQSAQSSAIEITKEREK